MSDTTNKSFPRSITFRKEGKLVNDVPYSSNAVKTWTNTFTGVKNPNWREAIREVRSATTNANGYRRQVWYATGSGLAEWYTSSTKSPTFYRRNQLDYYVPDIISMGQNTTVGSVDASTARNKAIERLYAALSSFESSAQTGEDLGEISQTYHMLRSPFKSLRTHVVRVLEGHRRALSAKSLASMVKGLADTVLEYRFGVQPLVRTLADGMVGLENRDYIAHYYPFSVSGKHEAAGQRDIVDSVNNRSLDVSVSRTLTAYTRFKGVWGVKADIDKRSVNDILSLRWRDVIPTIWNLIPYSFLVDYFTNVGTAIAGISVPWSGVRWCVETTRTDDTAICAARRWTPTSPSFYETSSLSPCIARYLETTWSRASVGELPRPVFKLEFDISKEHYQNIAALVVSRLPIIGLLTKKAVARQPRLASAFAGEVGVRGLKVPYPFHQ